MDLQTSSPQFGTAEFQSSPDRCTFCTKPLGGRCYRVNGALACSLCADRVKNGRPNGVNPYPPALLFGMGAAVLGLILYSTIAIVTGFEIGFASLAVGWLVGKAVMKGSKGVGGTKFQVTAALLTYMAVAVSAVPVGLYLMSKQSGAATSQGKDAPAKQGNTEESSAEPAAAEPASSQPADAKNTDAKETQMGVGQALLTLFGIGMIAPFLAFANPVQGAIGLVILFVGVRIAWQLAAGTPLEVEGPLDTQLAAKAGM
jgi:hypothetical protein